jgi:hypothetical protein
MLSGSPIEKFAEHDAASLMQSAYWLTVIYYKAANHADVVCIILIGLLDCRWGKDPYTTSSWT